MKKSKADTAETRKRIIEIAARTFKVKGIHATAITDVMSAAGLTHGAFYRHFSSKEQLVVEVCDSSMSALAREITAAAEGGYESFLKHVEDFLSPTHRDDRQSGCPLAAMGSELARADREVRRVASLRFQELIGIVRRASSGADELASHDEALFLLSSMIGAVTMSRIVDDPILSAQILDAARRKLVAQLDSMNGILE